MSPPALPKIIGISGDRKLADGLANLSDREGKLGNLNFGFEESTCSTLKSTYTCMKLFSQFGLSTSGPWCAVLLNECSWIYLKLNLEDPTAKSCP